MRDHIAMTNRKKIGLCEINNEDHDLGVRARVSGLDIIAVPSSQMSPGERMGCNQTSVTIEI